MQTILKLESGKPTTSLATMLLVLKALGMAADIGALAATIAGLGRRPPVPLVRRGLDCHA